MRSDGPGKLTPAPDWRDAMSELGKATTDRFGHPLDPIVGYARGPILKGTDEEVSRMLKARRMVGETTLSET